jgi:acetyl esterase/lipase
LAHVARARIIRDVLASGRTHRYGPDRSQRAELHLPPEGRASAGGATHPVMILIHGGSWRKRYGKIVMRALAGDLVRRGWAVWNIEYRRVGNGGGWPATFADVAAAIDHLDGLDARLDLARVSVLGHSAGGHLALWGAGRAKLPAGAPGFIDGEPRVRLQRVISQAGVCDLVGAYGELDTAVGALMGGAPEQLPERYAVGNPLSSVPLEMPVLLVHGVLDETVSVGRSRDYAAAALAAGGEVELVEIEGEAGRHRAHIDPREAAWEVVTRWLEKPAG